MVLSLSAFVCSLSVLGGLGSVDIRDWQFGPVKWEVLGQQLEEATGKQFEVKAELREEWIQTRLMGLTEELMLNELAAGTKTKIIYRNGIMTVEPDAVLREEAHDEWLMQNSLGLERALGELGSGELDEAIMRDQLQRISKLWDSQERGGQGLAVRMMSSWNQDNPAAWFGSRVLQRLGNEKLLKMPVGVPQVYALSPTKYQNAMPRGVAADLKLAETELHTVSRLVKEFDLEGLSESFGGWNRWEALSVSEAFVTVTRSSEEGLSASTVLFDSEGMVITEGFVAVNWDSGQWLEHDNKDSVKIDSHPYWVSLAAYSEGNPKLATVSRAEILKWMAGWGSSGGFNNRLDGWLEQHKVERFVGRVPHPLTKGLWGTKGVLGWEVDRVMREAAKGDWVEVSNDSTRAWVHRYREDDLFGDVEVISYLASLFVREQQLSIEHLAEAARNCESAAEFQRSVSLVLRVGGLLPGGKSELGWIRRGFGALRVYGYLSENEQALARAEGGLEMVMSSMERRTQDAVAQMICEDRAGIRITQAFASGRPALGRKSVWNFPSYLMGRPEGLSGRVHLRVWDTELAFAKFSGLNELKVASLRDVLMEDYRAEQLREQGVTTGQGELVALALSEAVQLGVRYRLDGGQVLVEKDVQFVMPNQSAPEAKGLTQLAGDLRRRIADLRQEFRDRG